MYRVLSTYLFVNHRLTTALLDRIWRAGIPWVELFCSRQHLDYRDQGQIAELKHWFRDAELKLHSLHAPVYSDTERGRSGPNAIVNIAELNKARRIQSVDEIKRTLEIAEVLPYKYLVQHIGMTGEEFDEHKIDSVFTSLEELSVFARHRGVEVLLENTPNDLASAEKLLLFFELTHMDLNVCFDTGHAHLRGGLENEFRLLKSRIRSTHVHDNDGVTDQHLFPLEPATPGGNIDWRATMGLLRSLPGDRPLLLELREVPDMAQPLDAVRRAFDELEGLNTDHES